MLDMFGLNCFRFHTKSGEIAVLKCHIKGAQLVARLLICVSPSYFYAIRSIRSTLHCFFTYLSVLRKNIYL